MNDVYFSSLVGRTVQIYRGGPHSNIGTLLDANGDYVALQTKTGEIIYYKTSHIKSIIDKTKCQVCQVKHDDDKKEESSSSSSSSSSSESLCYGHSFLDLCNHFIGRMVNVNGKGPNAKVGKLVDVKSDYLVIYDKKDGLIFFKDQHIVSMNLAGKNDEKDESESSNEAEESAEYKVDKEEEHWNSLMETYHQVSDQDFACSLAKLKYCWIKVNLKGPESVEGLLMEIHDDYLTLVVKEEINRIALYHIKSISLNMEFEDEESGDSNSDSEDQNSNSNSENNSSNNDDSSDNYSRNNQMYQQHLNRMMRVKRKRAKARQQNQGN